MRRNHQKVDFRPSFCNKFYFFVSNQHLECSQLSFDVHIVHVAQKLAKLGFSYDFSYGIFAIRLAKFDASSEAKYPRQKNDKTFCRSYQPMVRYHLGIDFQQTAFSSCFHLTNFFSERNIRFGRAVTAVCFVNTNRQQ